MDLLIDHQCPQCGAPAVLAESDRLYRCDFCKVRSYLLAREEMRYLLPDRAPAGRELIYVPYWRFKGMLFTCGQEGIRHRFTDVSRIAVDTPALPVSLGLRSQALRLKFVTPSCPGYLLKPALGRGAVLDLFARREAARKTGPVYFQARIGESLSLIYAPVYQTEGLHDAVLDRPVPQSRGAPLLTQLPGGRATAHLTFISAICPACGWDLEGQRDALVLICRNCDRVWRATGRGLEEIRIACLPATGPHQVYLPFWRIRASVHGAALSSYADLARLANLPVAIKPEWESRSFRFWSLAFKVRPATFVNLARSLTLAQPSVEPVERLPRSDLFSVTLPASEAAQSLVVILAAFAKPARRVLPRLGDIRIQAEKASLVYIPFDVGHHEYLQPELKLIVNKNQLALAGNL